MVDDDDVDAVVDVAADVVGEIPDNDTGLEGALFGLVEEEGGKEDGDDGKGEDREDEFAT